MTRWSEYPSMSFNFSDWMGVRCLSEWSYPSCWHNVRLYDVMQISNRRTMACDTFQHRGDDQINLLYPRTTSVWGQCILQMYDNFSKNNQIEPALHRAMSKLENESEMADICATKGLVIAIRHRDSILRAIRWMATRLRTLTSDLQT